MNLFSHITGFTLIAVLLISIWLVEVVSCVAFLHRVSYPVTVNSNSQPANAMGPTFKFMVKTGDKVIFRLPANCSNGYLLKNNNGELLARISKLGINIYDSQLSNRVCSYEEGTPICFTYSVESDRDFGVYYLVKSDTGTPCPISYLINGPDDDDMEKSTTITTNTPTTDKTTSSRWTPTFLSTNTLTTKLTSCRDGQFQCLNGECIPEFRQCDKRPDCRDRSDEQSCPCRDNEFQCSNRECIAESRRCDNRADCRDRSDEQNCHDDMEKSTTITTNTPTADKTTSSRWTPTFLSTNTLTTKLTSCRDGQFQCLNGECIPEFRQCDKRPDCRDRSDEQSCPCRDNEFQCSNRECIAESRRCDNRADCRDRSDEQNCPEKDPDAPCGYYEFQCLSGDQCIPLAYQCNEEIDCFDRSDEIACSAPTITLPPVAEIEVVLGATFIIICEASGAPTPLIVWLLNWGNIPTGDRVTVTSSDGRGVLTIEDARYEDAGAYTCEAINNRGSIFAISDALVIVSVESGPCDSPLFNVGATSSDECVRCFCFGQSVNCFSSDLQLSSIEMLNPVTLVRTDQEGNIPDNIVNFKANTREYQVLDLSRTLISGSYYWALPREFLGERLTSYGGELKYTIFYDTTIRRADPTTYADVIISGNGITLYFRARTQPSSGVPTSISVPLVENAWKRYDGTIRGDTPIAQYASREEFMTVLQNVDKFQVKASYDNRQSIVRIGGLFMTTAVDYSTEFGQAYLVENCKCPTGYTGLSCQTCAAGFTRIQSGGFLGTCSLCNCNGHSNDCDAITGDCLNCQHNTYSTQCQLCLDGYYGNARRGTPNDCQACPCPLADRAIHRTCLMESDGEVTCSNCPLGYEGRRCETCSEGYRGDPMTQGSSCIKIDIEEICDSRGSMNVNPDTLTRRCSCKENVIGQRCDNCKANTFYLTKNYYLGCIQCFCMGVSKSCQSTYWNRAQTGISFTRDEAGVTITDSQGRPIDGHRLKVEVNSREVMYRIPQDSDLVYWSLPSRFLGDKVTAYGGSLRFTLRYNSRQGSAIDSGEAFVKLTGNEITLIYRQPRTVRPNRPQSFKIVMFEQNWYRADGQPATREHLLLALADLDNILIRASFEEQQGDTGLRDVTLDIAENRRTRQDRAYAVEQCVCPVGYRGLSCEDCDTGYTRSGGSLYLGLCEPCNCNGHSNECDSASGICRNCQHNTGSDYCDRCAVGYYGDSTRGTRNDCQKCPCPLTESPNQFSPTCDLAEDGQVTCSACPAGHTGRRCETCTDGYTGNPMKPGDYCRLGAVNTCDCDTRGTVPNTKCNEESQQCQCKPFTQGRRCARCREGYFYLKANNAQGCLTCFCSGITNHCTSSSYYRDALRPVFSNEGSHNFVLLNRRMTYTISDGFIVDKSHNQITFNQFEGVQRERESLFFQLPAKFSGDRVTSYGGYLRFTLEFSARPEGRMSRDVDLEIISADQSLRLFNLFEPPIQEGKSQTYEILLRESSFNDLRSNTGPTRATFMTILSNIEGILIRATYHTEMESVTLRDVSMDTAIPILTDLGEAPMVEDCRCPEGYTGLSCERCSQGYLRVSDGRGGLPRCVGCNCNGHATSCDPDSGRCLDCQHNTEGDRCEVCSTGYYGDSTSGTPSDCRKCPCPLTSAQNQFSRTCVLAEDKKVTCDRCPSGYTGRQCNKCDQGYKGDPTQPGETCTPVEIGERPEVNVSPVRVEESVGSIAVFQCSVGDPEAFRVVWSRLDSRPLPDRASVSPRYALSIRDLRPEDTGRYVCTASNTYGVSRGRVTLQVNTGPSPIQVRIDNPRLEIDEGRTARVVCSAVSTSRETTYILTWSKQGSQLPAKALDQNGVLIIPNIQQSDAGNYICMGSDMFTVDEEISVVIVTDSGDQAPSVRIEPRYQTVDEGSAIQFACVVAGSPTPKIEWYRGGNREMNPEATITSDGIFRISRVSESDESFYYCKATNDLGMTEVRTILYVEGVTTITVIVRRTSYIVVAGQTARLECYSNDTTGRITLFWSRANGLPQGSRQDNGILTISDVQISYRGSYICSGSDPDTGRINSATTTLEVNVETQSEAPTVTVEPEKLVIPMGTTGTLRCKATGIPEPELTWMKSREQLAPNHQVTGNTLRINTASMKDRGIYVYSATNSAGMNQDWAIVEVETLRCAADEFECAADNKCLTADQICNRVYDCSDRRDESNCANLTPISVEVSPQNLRIRVGAQAIIFCIAQGLPQNARLEWVRRGNDLPMQSAVEAGKLMIPAAKPIDSGDYTCRVVGVPGIYEDSSKLEVVAINVGPSENATKCGQYEAVCQNGQCIRREYRCDGEADCADGSDEPEDCFSNLCEPNEFQCTSGQCVMKIWRCDGENDCVDGFDESKCAEKDPDAPCGYDEFQCLSGDQCIPLAYLCDEEIDCLDRSDEITCSAPTITLPPVAEIEVVLGATFVIICEASGAPTPLISWRLNLGHIPTGDRVTVTSSDGRGVLTIEDARYEDSGAYTCEAINNRGSVFPIPDTLVTIAQNLYI